MDLEEQGQDLLRQRQGLILYLVLLHPQVGEGVVLVLLLLGMVLQEAQAVVVNQETVLLEVLAGLATHHQQAHLKVTQAEMPLFMLLVAVAGLALRDQMEPRVQILVAMVVLERRHRFQVHQ